MKALVQILLRDYAPELLFLALLLIAIQSLFAHP